MQSLTLHKPTANRIVKRRGAEYYLQAKRGEWRRKKGTLTVRMNPASVHVTHEWLTFKRPLDNNGSCDMMKITVIGEAFADALKFFPDLKFIRTGHDRCICVKVF